MNCRVLPDEKPEYVTATLKQVIADDQVSVTIVGDVSIGPPSPMRQDLMSAISALTNTLWPGVPDRADDGHGRNRRSVPSRVPASRPTACRASSTIATTSGFTDATSA